MAILGVSNNNFFTRNIPVSTPVCAVKSEKQNEINSQKPNIYSAPYFAYRANYLPSFGKFKKYKEIQMYNKETGKIDKKTIVRDTIGDFVMFKVMSGQEELGYLHMDCDSVFKEDKFLSMEPDNNIPEITHLRSLRGDKYYGIGTSLIDVAIEESKKRGKKGALWCKTEQGYAYSLSPHRQNENPIPFYYKMGFKSPDGMIDSLIKRSLSSSNYALLPESTVLLLSSVDANKFKKYCASNYTYDKKSA